MDSVFVDDFDYDLPPEQVAQHPAPRRDASKLMVVNRATGALSHHFFRELPLLLQPNDLLVVNDSRVFPARLRARKSGSGGEFEVLLAEENPEGGWWALLRPGKRARPGTRLEICDRRGAKTRITATVLEKTGTGLFLLQFEGTGELRTALESIGEVPLPPYILRDGSRSMPQDRQRYQTIYARNCGSIAAPTAGLHFTRPLLRRVQALGIEVVHVTLHVGLGTFTPVKARHVEDHALHAEHYEITAPSAAAIRTARAAGRRVVAVGTTTVRVLEHVAGKHGGEVRADRGQTRLFIHPPQTFRAVDSLITNFHLPRSSLLMLVAAFAAPGQLAGRELMLCAYREAIRASYRFFSYGDAMLIQ